MRAWNDPFLRFLIKRRQPKLMFSYNKTLVNKPEWRGVGVSRLAHANRSSPYLAATFTPIKVRSSATFGRYTLQVYFLMVLFRFKMLSVIPDKTILSRRHWGTSLKRKTNVDSVVIKVIKMTKIRERSSQLENPLKQVSFFFKFYIIKCFIDFLTKLTALSA